MKRWFLFIGGGFLIGCFFASKLNINFLVIFLSIFILIAILSLFINTKAKNCILAFVLFCTIGMSLFTLKDLYVYNNIVKLDNQFHNITATIKDIEQNASNKFSYKLLVTNIDNSNVKNINTILYTDQFIDADLYDTISLNVKFFKPTNNNSFNAIDYYKSKDIFVLSSHYNNGDKQDIIVTPNNKKPIMYYIKSYNTYLSKIINNNFNINTSSIIDSMVLGNSSNIPEDIKSIYSDTSTSHIFAISGLHISVLSLFILKLTKKRMFIIRVLSPIIPVIFYIFLSGGHLSTIRSGIMLLILILSKLSLRKPDLINMLFFTGFIIVLSNVYAIMDIGFCMSFLATLGIVVLSDRLIKFLILQCNLTFLNMFALQSLSVCISANVFLIPFWVYTFKTINLLAPITNLIICILPPIILILSFLYVIICPFLPHSFINYLINILVSIQNGLIDILSNFKYLTIGLDYDIFNFWFLASLFVLIVFLLFKNIITIKLKYVCIFIITTFLLSNIYIIINKNITPYLYTIGDGNTSNIIICDKNTTTVISTSDDDYIDSMTANFLKGKGINKIENLILTYPNFNKYNDTISLVNSIDVDNIFLNEFNSNSNYILSNLNNNYSIFPIKENLQVSVNDSLNIKFNYIKTNINIHIKYNSSTIFIGDQKSINNELHSDIIFITKHSHQNLDVPQNLVFSLKKPYDYNDTNNEIKVLNTIYNKIKTFILK